mmetsp:Transcript_17543/g.35187  ORF Transcript_17543/g.35187 Transcript_17543/m.35187 type:complete len:330 (+) Transcript_17543:203-1192(+)
MAALAIRRSAITTACVVTLCALTLRRLYRHLNTRRLSGKGSTSARFTDDRPTLMFGGAASLWCYYTGVYYYLYYKFDLTKVRTTGISMGVTTAFATVLKMTPRQKFQIGLHWAAMIWNRPLKCFFMHSDDWVETGMRITKSFDITDKDVQKFLGSNTVYAGVTDISVFPPQHVVLSDCTSLRESLFWTTLSMRIFPFYRYPGWFRRMIIVDGVFSAMFCEPPNLDEGKAIRISPFAVPGAIVHPLYSEHFSAYDIAYSRRKSQMFSQLKIGFEAAQRAHGKLLERGLSPKETPQTDEFGQPGTIEHMMAMAESELEEFIKQDPLKTDWD